MKQYSTTEKSERISEIKVRHNRDLFDEFSINIEERSKQVAKLKESHTKRVLA